MGPLMAAVNQRRNSSIPLVRAMQPRSALHCCLIANQPATHEPDGFVLLSHHRASDCTDMICVAEPGDVHFSGDSD